MGKTIREVLVLFPTDSLMPRSLLMDYSQFIFSQLFMILLENTVRELTYDQIHPTMNEVWSHWLLTDSLYGRPDHEAEYDAMERYIKEHADGIKYLLTK